MTDQRAVFNPPPDGWYTFGSHVDARVPLVFSSDHAEDGMPLWERPASGPNERTGGD